MLSKQAFNALLKTLEEPPLHLKFILATTEVKKIPVTILSRCQRFDLSRIKSSELLEYIKLIKDKENGKITEDALKLIVKISEGSVRDALSLLDRALLSAFATILAVVVFPIPLIPVNKYAFGILSALIELVIVSATTS